MTYSTELAEKYISEYRLLHTDPWFKKNGYVYGYGDGKVVVDSFPIINNLIRNHKAESILDYGCGKAVAHTVKNLFIQNGVNEVYLYDPAVDAYQTLPDKIFGGVICADVMEHIPEQNVDFVLDQVVSFADKFVFFVISCNPAKYNLKNGENVHITIKQPGWWLSKLKKYDKPIYAKFSYNKSNIFVDVMNGTIRNV